MIQPSSGWSQGIEFNKTKNSISVFSISVIVCLLKTGNCLLWWLEVGICVVDNAFFYNQGTLYATTAEETTRCTCPSWFWLFTLKGLCGKFDFLQTTVFIILCPFLSWIKYTHTHTHTSKVMNYNLIQHWCIWPLISYTMWPFLDEGNALFS